MGPSAVGGISSSLFSAPEQPELWVWVFLGLEVWGSGPLSGGVSIAFSTLSQGPCTPLLP